MDTNYDPWCYIEDKRFYRLLINLLQHHIDLNLTTVFRDLRANLHETSVGDQETFTKTAYRRSIQHLDGCPLTTWQAALTMTRHQGETLTAYRHIAILRQLSGRHLVRSSHDEVGLEGKPFVVRTISILFNNPLQDCSSASESKGLKTCNFLFFCSLLRPGEKRT